MIWKTIPLKDEKNLMRGEILLKIKTVKLKNFRSYKDEVSIDFCDLTAFVGKNDIGKSSILEALDIFF